MKRWKSYASISIAMTSTRIHRVDSIAVVIGQTRISSHFARLCGRSTDA